MEQNPDYFYEYTVYYSYKATPKFEPHHIEGTELWREFIKRYNTYEEALEKLEDFKQNGHYEQGTKFKIVESRTAIVHIDTSIVARVINE